MLYVAYYAGWRLHNHQDWLRTNEKKSFKEGEITFVTDTVGGEDGKFCEKAKWNID